MQDRTEAHVRLTYRDTARPGVIVMTVAGTDTRIILTPGQAAALAGRLLDAVGREGYDLAARKRARS